MEPQKAPEKFPPTGDVGIVGAKKIWFVLYSPVRTAKICRKPKCITTALEVTKCEICDFWLNFREVAWNLRDLRGLRGTCVRGTCLACRRGTCVACVEPAWLAWNLRGTCVACVEPACVAPAWPACNLRATCVACVQPAWHLRGLRGTTCMEKPEEFFFFPPGTAKNVKTAENATKTRKNYCSVTWGEKRIVVFAWGFLRVAPPTQKIGKILPSCPQNKFSPKMFFGLQGMAWEGSEGGLWHFANDFDTEKPLFAQRRKFCTIVKTWAMRETINTKHLTTSLPNVKLSSLQTHLHIILFGDSKGKYLTEIVAK